MALERFTKVQPVGPAPDRREFVELGQRIERALARISSCPLIDGRLIAGVVLTAATTSKIEHGLGRTYVGFIPVRNSSGATLDENYTTTDRDQFITLAPSADATVDLWVF
jgi:hypothetical protein